MGHTNEATRKLAQHARELQALGPSVIRAVILVDQLLNELKTLFPNIVEGGPSADKQSLFYATTSVTTVHDLVELAQSLSIAQDSRARRSTSLNEEDELMAKIDWNLEEMRGYRGCWPDLRPKQKEAVWLCVGKGMTRAQAGRELGIGPSAVSKRLERAKNTRQERFRDQLRAIRRIEREDPPDELED